MRLQARFELLRPLEELELKLVQATLDDRRLFTPHEETVLRTALSLARLVEVREGAEDVPVGSFLAQFRQEVLRRLQALAPAHGPVRRELLVPHLAELERRTVETRAALLHRFEGKLSEGTLDQELRHKALVLVLGGGGGAAYPYLGAMGLLDEYGLRPALLSGTSMGAVLALFRARRAHFDREDLVSIVGSLSWSRLFRAVSTRNRYGVPAALRLFLRAGVGRFFGVDVQGGEGPRLKDLAIPTIVSVSGVRAGRLPHPLEFYEKLISLDPRHLARWRVLPRWTAALAELVARPDVLTAVHLGADDSTTDFDALDAAGFSSALPGVIHYDVLREDAAMHRVLGNLFQARRLFRLVDGGLVDNLPARAAWRAVQAGRIGTRNALVVALNGFATSLRAPLWLPLHRLAELSARANRPYAHLVHDFHRTLGPLDIVPPVDRFLQALDLGRKALAPQIPLLTRLLAPLPHLRDRPA